ncbi:nucleophile aminohydrolase [Melampsora americana]|nr:nucleophile aminohydrolase [Melampsora americana]
MNDLSSRIRWDRIEPAFNSDYATFSSRRSVVFGTQGMVACPNPLASSAGIEILNKGGNAADAAVATAAALNVVDPCNCGIGGDAFCLFFNSADQSLKGLNGSGRSPAALSLEKARELGISGREIPIKNINSVTVPGSCAAWVDTIKLFGSGRVSLAEILQPAIRLADEGFPVSEIVSVEWQRSESLLKAASPNGHEMLLDGQRAPRTGEIMTNKTLAKTFKTVAQLGRDGFYQGRIAEEIVKLIKSKGGVMDLSDLESHTSTPVDPISYTYHAANQGGVTLHELPPNGQGLTALMALGILECLEESGMVDMGKIQHNSVEWLHTLIECMRLAFADTRAYVADPYKQDVPVKAMLDKEYLRNRSKLFDPTKAKANVSRGSPTKTQETVYFTTGDKDGNSCSFIMSNYAGFGTGAIPAGCGFTLQNRGCNFNLDPKHPNCLEPGKRPYHTIIPAMVTRKNDLFLSFGVMGGFMQPQGHLQVLMNMLHHGFNVQSALDAPRFCISAAMPDATDDQRDACDINGVIFLEEGIDQNVAKALTEMGHQVKIITGPKRGMFGRGQVIQKVVDKLTGRFLWASGSDPRADGQAIAQI